MKRRVALITESHTCLPAELRKQLGIRALPFTLLMDGVELRDGVDITPAEFYRRLPSMNGTVVKTSSVSPGAYLAAMREAASEADGILVITISSKMSASYQSAVVAAEQFKDVPVKVLDSGNVASAQGLVVLETAKCIAAGADLDEAHELAVQASSQVELYAYIYTFDYLRRSGHVRAVEALAASALSIKPVMRFKDGDATLVAKKPNVRKAKKDIVKHVADFYEEHGPLNMILCHADALENCEDLAVMLRSRVAIEYMLIGEFTPVMGAHTGPGVVGAAFLPANHWGPQAG